MRRYIAALLLSIPAIWVLLFSGYFPIHDNTQVVRVAQMAQSLNDLHFPVRWVKDLGFGFGYPIFNFYNPLPYYFGAIFNLSGFNALIATKIMFIFPILLAALSMYKLVRKYLGKYPALMASAFYTYAPYHAVQIYVRGSVAEYWAYAFVPLVIYFFLEKKVIAAAISLALLILSHNLTAIMFIPFLAILFFINLLINNKNKISHLLFTFYSTLLALGISAFFWLPMFFEKGFTSVNIMVTQQFDPLQHFVFIRQLLSSPWGFAGSAPGPHDGLSFMLGYLHIFLSILAIILFKKIWKNKKARPLYLFSLASLTFSLFMLLSFSRIFWQNINALAFIQFPWRFLSFSALATSLMAAFVVKLIKPKLKTLLTIVILLVLVTLNIQYFQPQFKFGPDINPQTLLDPKRVKYEVSARSDEYKPIGAFTPQSLEEIPSSRYTIELEAGESIDIIQDKTHRLMLSYNLKTSKLINFNIYSFPGWILTLDDQKTNLITTDQKLLQAKLPAGQHQILLQFKNTPIRSFANILSLVSLVAIIFISKKDKIYT